MTSYEQRPSTPSSSLLPVDFPTAAPFALVTAQRRPAVGLSKRLAEPGVARAFEAADYEHPRGSTERKPVGEAKGYSILQSHAEFFDRDKDGVISISDTFLGFRALGFPIWFSIIAVLVINLNFSYPTQESWMPDPFFRVNIKNIHKTKHGSDTGVYDKEGRFVPRAFEDLWTKYDGHGENYLSGSDLVKMFHGQRDVLDLFGMFAFIFEWGTLYLLAADSSGRLSKEVVRSQYDGTLFYKIEEEERKKVRRAGGRGSKPLRRALFAAGNKGE